MPLSLLLFVHKVYQDSVERKFEKHNRILTFDQIKELPAKEGLSLAVEVFSSAVVDHKPVNGRPYYLSPPVAPLLYHDYFKQCLIAHTLYVSYPSSEIDIKENAVHILQTLYKAPSAGYVNIFVWAALGVRARDNRKLFDEQKNDFLSAFDGPVSSVLGALVFMDQFKESKKDFIDLRWFNEAQRCVRYKVQKALLYYYLMERGESFGFTLDLNSLDSDIRDFLILYRQSVFARQDYFEEGLKEIGLIPRTQSGGLYEGTQQAQVARLLRGICMDHISAIGFYIKHFWANDYA